MRRQQSSVELGATSHLQHDATQQLPRNVSDRSPTEQ